MVDDKQVITHLEPVWRTRANYAKLAVIDTLAKGDGYFQYEQLAVRKKEDDTFEICCVPFLLDNLNLGDTVAFSDNGTFRKVKASGHCSLKLYNSRKKVDFTEYEAISQKIIATGAHIEYTEDGRLWAIDVEDSVKAGELEKMLSTLVDDGYFVDYAVSLADIL